MHLSCHSVCFCITNYNKHVLIISMDIHPSCRLIMSQSLGMEFTKIEYVCDATRSLFNIITLLNVLVTLYSGFAGHEAHGPRVAGTGPRTRAEVVGWLPIFNLLRARVSGRICQRKHITRVSLCLL